MILWLFDVLIVKLEDITLAAQHGGTLLELNQTFSFLSCPLDGIDVWVWSFPDAGKGTTKAKQPLHSLPQDFFRVPV